MQHGRESVFRWCSIRGWAVRLLSFIAHFSVPCFSVGKSGLGVLASLAFRERVGVRACFPAIIH